MKARAGVEVEFDIDRDVTSNDEVVHSLEEQGLEAAFESYNHSTRPHWKVTTDASCGDGDEPGLELVSPILTDGTAKTIVPAMRAVTDSGGFINDKCGLHVHIELPEYQRDYDVARRVARFYHQTHEWFDGLIDPSRREGTYCRWHDDVDEFIYGCDESRYMAVNYQCLNRQPTIEFREHQGTLNAARTYGWMSFCDTLVDVALSDTPTIDRLRRVVRYSAPTETLNIFERAGIDV